ncbi:MAG TPA: hypothetical protein VHL34_07460 [Rhizomicrobium sp.]|jgi:tetratricopeptide (TPR) repeat protein|nr:hypothetical protein [Rhizomicrobium sp.]
MNKTFVRAAFSTMLLCGVATAAMTAAPAYAADKAPAGPKASHAVGVELQAAITAVQAKDYATAKTHIVAARALPSPTDVDTIDIDIVDAYVAMGENDHPRLLTLYKGIVASPLFTQVQKPDEQAGTLKNLMLLQMETKDYPGAVQTGERIASSGLLDDKTASSLATAYYMSKDYAKARALAQKSIDAAKAGNAKPAQAALQILFNSYADDNNQNGARDALEMMIQYYPEPNSWAKLIDNFDMHGLSDMQILQLYRLRVLSGATGDLTDYTIGSDQAMKSGYPGDARSMLQAAQSRGVAGVGPKLAAAQAKASGDEKTLGANDAAAAKAGNGVMDVLVAEQYYGYGRYDEAVTAAKRAIAKGGVKDPEEPKMIVGMALAAGGKYADAITALNQVGGSEKQKRLAHLWVLYAQSKMAPAPAAQ